MTISPEQPYDKRVVLQYTKGPLAELWQLLGTVSQLKCSLQATELPAFVDPVDFLDHKGACSLVAVKPRYVHYRELMAPATSTFHPSQQ